MTSCDICCEKYNKSTRKEVNCEYVDCGFSVCKICVRTYLIGTTADPNCMKCKKPWSEKFLVENLNRSFCDKEYKVHRKSLLTDRELSRLPETMQFADKYIKIDVEEKKAKVVSAEIKELSKLLATLKVKHNVINHNIYTIKTGKTQVGERQKFIMSCPNNVCRGYLSTQYKCELCELFTCPHCLEIIGHSKTEEHTCNPDSVASAELIKKETKGCPRCGVRIFKISGCNQMWCTECKVAFDYSTGKIDTGVVHNPHYYAHIATLAQGAPPRNPQDVLCGGLATINTILRLQKLKTCFPVPADYAVIVTKLQDMHRVIAHITYLELPNTRQAVRNLGDGQQIRIDYILGKIDKAGIGTKIYAQDVRRKKQTELLHIYEIYSVVGIENFAMCVDPVSLALDDKAYIDLIDERIKVLDNLRKYCNDEFAKISITYNLIIMHINDLWTIRRKKYAIKGDPAPAPTPVPIAM